MTLTALQKQVETLGGTLETDSEGRFTVYQCVAPDGQHWIASSGPHIRLEWMARCPNSRTAKSEAIADAAERVALDLEPCDCGEC